MKKKVNKSEIVGVWINEKDFKKFGIYEPLLTMDKALEPLRFVKYAMKHQNKKWSQIVIITTYMDMKLKTLFKIIRARWDIENSIFNNFEKNVA